MKQRLKLCLLVLLLVVPLVLVGCGGQDGSAVPSVNTAANPFAGNYFGKALKGTAFEAGIAVRILNGTASVAIVGPNISGIFPATGTATNGGAIAFSINCGGGDPVQYSFSGTMKNVSGVLSGAGTWSSPTRGSGKWSIGLLKNVGNPGSWVLTKSGSPNRTYSWDNAYAALVSSGGKTMLVLAFDKTATASPMDALLVVGNPQNAVVGTGYDLSDMLLRWTYAANEHYYAKDTVTHKVNFSLKQLNLNGKLSGKITVTLVPFGSGSGTVGWSLKSQPFANVLVVRDWTP